MRDDNKGYSIVELIIVIAIMAIITGFLAYSFSMVTGQQPRECANNISVALDKAKIYSMSKSGSSDAYVEIWLDSNKGYVASYYAPNSPIKVNAIPGTDYIKIEEEIIGKKTVSVECFLADASGTSFEINGTNRIRIYYDRITGGFKKAAAVLGGSTMEEYCAKIAVSRGREYQITFITATGKHSLERIH